MKRLWKFLLFKSVKRVFLFFFLSKYKNMKRQNIFVSLFLSQEIHYWPPRPSWFGKPCPNFKQRHLIIYRRLICSKYVSCLTRCSWCLLFIHLVICPEALIDLGSSSPGSWLVGLQAWVLCFCSESIAVNPGVGNMNLQILTQWLRGLWSDLMLPLTR